MPLFFVRDDITTMEVDAIVNAANPTLLGGGGVDGAIHRAAGPELLAECRTLGGCEVGQAKVTKGYALPARFVIHTVGPVWRGGAFGEEALLTSCYEQSLLKAVECGFESVAFPLISSGAYGYPKEEAFQVAVGAIQSFLEEHELRVYLVLFGEAGAALSRELVGAIEAYVDERFEVEFEWGLSVPEEECLSENVMEETVLFHPRAMTKRLEDVMREIEETFSQMLLRLIDEKEMTDVEAYKRANVDRRLFSKIRNDVEYRPKKSTVIAFAMALRCDLEETKELLLKAGFALSRSSKFDIIVEYFIEQGNFNVFELNEVLFAFEQPLVGA